MPKIKTCRAAAKRFKKTGTGKLVRNKAYKSHILTKKSQKRFSGNQCFLSQYGRYENCCKKRSHADYSWNDL